MIGMAESIADRAVVVPPHLDGLLGIALRGKSVHAEAVVATRAIEASVERASDFLAKTDDLASRAGPEHRANLLAPAAWIARHSRC